MSKNPGLTMFPSMFMTLSGRCFLRKNVFCIQSIIRCACVPRFAYLRVKHDTSPLVDPEVLFNQTTVLHWEQTVRKTYQPIWRGHPGGYVGGKRGHKTRSGEDSVIILQPRATPSESECKSGCKSECPVSARRTRYRHPKNLAVSFKVCVACDD